jgi:tyrosyl-tRNA synthetase
MLDKIISVVITFVVSGILGYSVSVIKNYKSKLDKKDENSEMLKSAMMTILQSNLTNTYFVYENLKEIPDYIYKNWLNLLSIYEKLGGDDYVHVLSNKMQEWEIKQTDILNK